MGTTDTTIEAIRGALTPVIDTLGLSLYDVELHGAGAARTLRVTVDREGGVDIDAIADATRAVSGALDDEGSLSGPYLLEVSSPGIERTLRTPAHYASARGSVVSIKLRTADATRRVHGTLVDSDDAGCTIETDGVREQIAYADVTQARTVFEWTPQPRPGQRRRAGAGASSGSRGTKGASA